MGLLTLSLCRLTPEITRWFERAFLVALILWRRIGRRILRRWIRQPVSNSTTHVSSSASGHLSQLSYWVVLRQNWSRRWINRTLYRQPYSGSWMLGLWHRIYKSWDSMWRRLTGCRPKLCAWPLVRNCSLPRWSTSWPRWPGYTTQAHRCWLWAYGDHRLAQSFLDRCLRLHVITVWNVQIVSWKSLYKDWHCHYYVYMWTFLGFL